MLNHCYKITVQCTKILHPKMRNEGPGQII